MRFRYFDPFEQAVVEGDVGNDVGNANASADVAELSELVGRVSELRPENSPALELRGADGSSVVLGVDHDRAVVLWTSADGTTRHSIGGRRAGERASFDYFGACTQMPGHYAVPLAAAVSAVCSYVGGARPSLALALD